MRRLPPCPLASHVAEQVLKVVHRRRALVRHQLIVLHGPQQLVDEEERQLDLVGDFPAGAVAAGQQELQDQRLRPGCPSRPARCNDSGSMGRKLLPTASFRTGSLSRDGRLAAVRLSYVLRVRPWSRSTWASSFSIRRRSRIQRPDRLRPAERPCESTPAASVRAHRQVSRNQSRADFRRA